MSDNYEYMKSLETQNIDDYAPYVDKQHNNHINSTYYNGSCLECKKCWVLDPHHFVLSELISLFYSSSRPSSQWKNY